MGGARRAFPQSAGLAARPLGERHILNIGVYVRYPVSNNQTALMVVAPLTTSTNPLCLSCRTIMAACHLPPIP